MHRPRLLSATLIALSLNLGLSGATTAGDDPVAEAIRDYMDFATEAEGILLPQQLTQEVFEKVFFVDVRSPEHHAAGTIPGAVNIDWREIPGRLDEIPETGMVVLFCNTGVRSSQATFAARVMGRGNVVVLQSGYQGWLRDGAYHPL